MYTYKVMTSRMENANDVSKNSNDIKNGKRK